MAVLYTTTALLIETRRSISDLLHPNHSFKKSSKMMRRFWLWRNMWQPVGPNEEDFPFNTILLKLSAAVLFGTGLWVRFSKSIYMTHRENESYSFMATAHFWPKVLRTSLIEALNPLTQLLMIVSLCQSNLLSMEKHKVVTTKKILKNIS